MYKIKKLIICATVIVFSLSGCSSSISKKSEPLDNEKAMEVVDTINNSYVNLLNSKGINFEVESKVMTMFIEKARKDNGLVIGDIKLKATWDNTKIKNFEEVEPIPIEDPTVKLGITKMETGVEKGLNSTLQMLYSLNGGNLISAKENVQNVYKKGNEIIVQCKTQDPSAEQVFYFDNNYKLKKKILYKLHDGGKDIILEFLPEFKEINGKYILVKIKSNVRANPLTTNIRYIYQEMGESVFPAIIEYVFITDKLTYSEVFEIKKI